MDFDQNNVVDNHCAYNIVIQMMTGISIVVPHFRDEHLSECLRAISNAWEKLPETKRQFVEVIVVDDNSPDSFIQPELVVFIKYIKLSSNRGVANARNVGANEAQFSHVLFVDADVLLDSNYLVNAFEYLSKYPDTKVLQCPHWKVPANVNASLFQHFVALTWFSDNISFADKHFGTLLVSGCVVFNKDFFNTIGGFSARYTGSGGEEFEILSRMPKQSIVQDFNLISYHFFDSLVDRVKKIFKRGVNYFEVIRLNKSFPRQYESALAVRGFLSCLMSVSILVALISRKAALVLYLMSVCAYVLLNYKQMRYYYKNHSLLLAGVSILYRQIEYTAACAGYLLGLIKTKVKRNEFKFLVSKTPSYFIFWVTQNCNFTCDHCFNYIENQKKNNDLSISEIESFSKNLGDLKYVTLAGGEPMLRRDLAQIAEVFYRNNNLQVLNVVTNGWFTDRIVSFAETVLDRCPHLFLSISCSLDGLKDVHDKIRKKEGSFDQVMNTFTALQKLMKTPHGSRLAISGGGTYNAENATTFLDTAKYLHHKFGIPYMTSLIRGSNVQNNDLKKVNISHYRETANQVAALNQETFMKNYPFRSLRLALSQTVTDIAYESFENNKMIVPCKAGEKGFVLTSNGDLMLCEILNIRLGNIRNFDHNPMKILKAHSAKMEVKKIKDTKCHCTWECFQSMNAVYSPKAYPLILKHLAKNTIKKYSGDKPSNTEILVQLE